MATETAIEASYRKALRAQVGMLPPDLAEPWRREARRILFSPDEAKALHMPRQFRKFLPPGKWSPATSLLLIAGVNDYRRAGEMLDDRCTDFRELVQRHRVVQLLRGPLQRLTGPTKIMMLRAAKTFAERVLKVSAEHLAPALLRIRATELARDYTGVLKEYAEYRDAALALEPTMRPGEPHDLVSAVMARNKAIANLAVSIDPRLGEIGGLERQHVVIDGNDVTVVIPARISKEDIDQSRALDAECALPVIEYVLRARPLLSSLRPEGAPECSALWLTQTGSALCQMGVSQALTITLSRAMGAPVGSRILRKVMASRDDLADAQIGAALGHSLRSLVGIEVYSERDESKARKALQAIWAGIDARIGALAT